MYNEKHLQDRHRDLLLQTAVVKYIDKITDEESLKEIVDCVNDRLEMFYGSNEND